MQTYNEEGQVSIYDLDSEYGKMFREPSPVETRKGKTSASSSKNSSELSAVPFLSLDLTPGHGNLLGESYWEMISPWRGGASTLNTGVSPRDAKGSSLWQILEVSPHPKYYLSQKACLGILRRARERGKELPTKLKQALEIQASVSHEDSEADQNNDDICPSFPTAFAQNQRDEVRDLNDVAGALSAQPGMKQQTYLCLNDQGGQAMSCTQDVVGTLRAQEHGHQPLVLADAHSKDNTPALYESHKMDCRYKGPLDVSPTISAGAGTGGNNLPLVEQNMDVFCITGNAIDRQPHNGGNGIGYQENLAYTLTATDHHAIYSRQRSDILMENEVVSTESARQHKDATDLVMQPYQETVGTLGHSDHKGINNQYVGEDKCVVEGANLIRRLTPLECERLQGFPDHWTDIPKATDSARYKALGNSVAIPCVDFVLSGIAQVLRSA